MERHNRIKKWLDLKVEDKMIESKYAMYDWSLNPYLDEYEDLELFYRYYNENDQDIKAIDVFYLENLEFMRENGTFYDNEELEYLDTLIERYIDENGVIKKRVFIAPNTNRYHANYLFKQIIDNCINNNLVYDFSDEDGNVESLLLFDVNMKDKFYKFCYDNTTKSKSKYI